MARCKARLVWFKTFFHQSDAPKYFSLKIEKFDEVICFAIFDAASFDVLGILGDPILYWLEAYISELGISVFCLTFKCYFGSSWMHKSSNSIKGH